MKKYYLAIDIGASSGRHIVGWRENGKINTKEIYRFQNEIQMTDGHLGWDAEGIFQEVKNGIRAVFTEFQEIESLAVDTWGVDYVLLKNNEEIWPAYAYRDCRTEEAVKEVHGKIPFSELYHRTGCQFQPFNSIYQLYDDLENGRLKDAADFLMMPEYLSWKLCGVKAKEFTNATTTGMVNADTHEFDKEIINTLGLPERLFPRLSRPGTVLGKLLPEIVQEAGGNTQVTFCATHDTGSAVEGIPMEGNCPYISSGTWSLLGVKTPEPITNIESEKANYSNEGGVGYNRYQKNIMGLWVVNRLKQELCPDLAFEEIVKLAEKSQNRVTANVNTSDFLAPYSMKEAFDKAANHALKTIGDYFSCAYRSLAASYRQSLEELERNTGMNYERLYIVGGGAKNQFLNRLTQEAVGKEVIALPIEATALGNLKIQMEVIK